MTSSRKDFYLQVSAHAGRTKSARLRRDRSAPCPEARKEHTGRKDVKIKDLTFGTIGNRHRCSGCLGSS
jgi:hypothetical protein